MQWRRTPVHRIVSPLAVGVVTFLVPKDAWWSTSVAVFVATMVMVMFDGKPISKAFIAGTVAMSVVVGTVVQWLN